jgi:outer membrane protein assembly factor BamB
VTTLSFEARSWPAAVIALVALGCGGAEDYGWVLSSQDRPIASPGGFTLRWNERLTPEYNGPFMPVERAVPVLDPARDRVYVGSSAGVFYAMTSGGRRIYRFDALGSIESEAALDIEHDQVYVGTEQGDLYRLRASDGDLGWREAAGGPIRQAPLLDAERVYVVTDTDVVTAFDREDGGSLWSYTRDAPEGFSITQHAGLAMWGGLLFTAFTDGTIVAFHPRNGEIVWERETSIEVDASEGGRPRFVDVDTTPVPLDGKLYAASFAGGFYTIDAESGTVLSRNEQMTGVVSIVLHEGRLFLSSAEHGLVAMAADGTRELWRHAFERGAPSTVSIANGQVLVGESNGSFISLDVDTGAELSRFESGYGFSARAAVARGRGFVLSNGGTLFAFVL